MNPIQALPGLISMGTSILGGFGAPSRSDMLKDLQGFRTGLDNQLSRIGEYRSQESPFWKKQQELLKQQAYNSADFSNLMSQRFNTGVVSGIQNQQNLDRTTQGVQGIGGLMSDAWMGLQKHTDQMYQDYLSGENQYSQALTGIRSAQWQQKQDNLQNILGAMDSLMAPNEEGESAWSLMLGK